ncbi:MAG: CAP domain-containing protein [Actinobacteria bacterium]|nr:CAP domain-containing protein [Actinomycetota bacterium]
MRVRIVALAALVSLPLLGAVPAALAEECPVADRVIDGCRPAPAPDAEPAPEPQPETQPQQQSQPQYQPGHQPAAVSRLLTLMNNERRSRGLPLFAQRGDVTATSAGHSEAMAAAGTIWHNDAYFTAANKKRLDAVLLGENVARNPDIDDAHRRLMNSPGHRANLLDSRFTVVGLAVYRSSTGSLYVTQNFLQPRVAEAPRAAAPAPAKPKAAAAPAPSPSTTTPPAPAPAPVAEATDTATQVLSATDPSLLAAPASVPGPAGGAPVGALAALAALALVAAGGLAVHKHSGVLPLLRAHSGR